jgi:hypothetical protein
VLSKNVPHKDVCALASSPPEQAHSAVLVRPLPSPNLSVVPSVPSAKRLPGFNQAIQQFREDQTRIPGLFSTALGQLGTGLSQTGGRLATEAQPLINIGAAQQGLNQRNLDVLREAFLEERDFPTRGIDVLRGALGLTPNTLGIGTAGTSVAPSPNVAGSIITGISQAPQVIQGGTAVLNFLRGLGGTAGVSEGMFARGGLVNLSPGNN